MRSQDRREEQSVAIGQALAVFAGVMVLGLLAVWLSGVEASPVINVGVTLVAMAVSGVSLAKSGQ